MVGGALSSSNAFQLQSVSKVSTLLALALPAFRHIPANCCPYLPVSVSVSVSGSGSGSVLFQFLSLSWPRTPLSFWVWPKSSSHLPLSQLVSFCCRCIPSCAASCKNIFGAVCAETVNCKMLLIVLPPITCTTVHVSEWEWEYDCECKWGWVCACFCGNISLTAVWCMLSVY